MQEEKYQKRHVGLVQLVEVGVTVIPVLQGIFSTHSTWVPCNTAWANMTNVLLAALPAPGVEKPASEE